MSVNRQDRVKRLKRTIILTLIIAILIPIVLCIFLLIKVYSLEREIKDLYQTRIEVLKSEQETLVAVPPQKNLSIEESGIVSIYDGELISDAGQERNVRKVYITFDDGPSLLTQEILSILDQYHVKATFFVVGKEDENLKPIYKEIVEKGHTIGMHSYSHQYQNIYESVESFQEDFQKINNLIYNETGVKAKYYRFPGGSSNQVSKLDMREYIKYIKQENVEYFDWNASTGDATSTNLSTEEIMENTFKTYEQFNTTVLLMHDNGNRRMTVDALPQIIEKYQELGVELLPISESTDLVQHIKIEG